MPVLEKPLRCGFCYDREQGKHGEIKKEWSSDWGMPIAVCRKHAIEIEQVNDEIHRIERTEAGDQAIIPETPARSVPSGPLVPKVGQNGAPLPLEMVEEDGKQGRLL